MGDVFERRATAEVVAEGLRRQFPVMRYAVVPMDEGDAPPAWHVLDQDGKLLQQGWGAPPSEIHGLTAGCRIVVRGS